MACCRGMSRHKTRSHRPRNRRPLAPPVKDVAAAVKVVAAVVKAVDGGVKLAAVAVRAAGADLVKVDVVHVKAGAARAKAEEAHGRADVVRAAAASPVTRRLLRNNQYGPILNGADLKVGLYVITQPLNRRGRP